MTYSTFFCGPENDTRGREWCTSPTGRATFGIAGCFYSDLSGSSEFRDTVVEVCGCVCGLMIDRAYVFIFSGSSVLPCACAHTHAHARARVRAYTRTHTYVRARAHTHTHTQHQKMRFRAAHERLEQCYRHVVARGDAGGDHARPFTHFVRTRPDARFFEQEAGTRAR